MGKLSWNVVEGVLACHEGKCKQCCGYRVEDALVGNEDVCHRLVHWFVETDDAEGEDVETNSECGNGIVDYLHRVLDEF